MTLTIGGSVGLHADGAHSNQFSALSAQSRLAGAAECVLLERATQAFTHCRLVPLNAVIEELLVGDVLALELIELGLVKRDLLVQLVEIRADDILARTRTGQRWSEGGCDSGVVWHEPLHTTDHIRQQ